MILTICSDAAGFGLEQGSLSADHSLGQAHSATQPMDRALHINTPADSCSSIGDINSQMSFILSARADSPPSLDCSSSPAESSYGYNEDEDGPDGAESFYYRPLALEFPSTPAPSLPLHLTDPWGQRASTTDKQTAQVNTLSPLEMPDGSMRLTANWLPVDPAGGFTISGSGQRGSAHGRMLSDGNIVDTGMLPYAQGCFSHHGFRSCSAWGKERREPATRCRVTSPSR